MQILKSNNKYDLVFCVNNRYSGIYQILEKTNEHPSGETCGVYYLKKDALKDFSKLTRK